MRPYLEGRLRIAREQGGEGLIAELVRVEKEGGRISPDEMVAMIFLLLGAGSETTTHLISGSVYELIKEPTLRDWLETDWSRANLAVEEFLRFVSPVPFSKPRFVRKDTPLGGVRLKKGDKIMAMVAAANIDPKANEDPEKLFRDTRIGTLPSGQASTFASAINSRASRANARLKLCSRAGRCSSSQFSPQRLGGENGQVSGPSRSYRW